MGIVCGLSFFRVANRTNGSPPRGLMKYIKSKIVKNEIVYLNGKNFKKFRDKHNLSLKQIGDAIGYSRAYLCRLEKEERPLSLYVLDAIMGLIQKYE